MTQEQSEKLLGKKIVATKYEDDNGDETLRITFDDDSELYIYINSHEGDLIFQDR